MARQGPGPRVEEMDRVVQMFLMSSANLSTYSPTDFFRVRFEHGLLDDKLETLEDKIRLAGPRIVRNMVTEAMYDILFEVAMDVKRQFQQRCAKALAESCERTVVDREIAAIACQVVEARRTQLGSALVCRGIYRSVVLHEIHAICTEVKRDFQSRVLAIAGSLVLSEVISSLLKEVCAEVWEQAQPKNTFQLLDLTHKRVVKKLTSGNPSMSSPNTPTTSTPEAGSPLLPRALNASRVGVDVSGGGTGSPSFRSAHSKTTVSASIHGVSPANPYQGPSRSGTRTDRFSSTHSPRGGQTLDSHEQPHRKQAPRIHTSIRDYQAQQQRMRPCPKTAAYPQGQQTQSHVQHQQSSQEQSHQDQATLSSEQQRLLAKQKAQEQRKLALIEQSHQRGMRLQEEFMNASRIHTYRVNGRASYSEGTKRVPQHPYPPTHPSSQQHEYHGRSVHRSVGSTMPQSHHLSRASLVQHRLQHARGAISPTTPAGMVMTTPTARNSVRK
eukprot:m.267948 g.267948  ORF g.267948 m.267948 type:complete len:498 (+) comp15647_c1_seq1:62-1555(+)